ncbi:hypothetical protein [Amycolatopsis saalfeldensis]|uniref:Phage shock protein B n=1 Tax=Amycolatopsis saalfeldensis TaxID=394193 RepID=A0A1H8YME5_9PSEU|nr:hypothetical protein [Amycolatopsis saalfeldensis]SEP53329.1 hypothetical protein SAMN04489732_12653 [Amycolatopsis saalfeldensis]
MPTWVVAVIAIAAVTATYFSCVRPMLRGRSHCGAPAGRDDLDRQIAELREEVRVLRAQEVLDGDR